MTHASDPIAIIGTACRVPGACNLDDFWHLLSTGQDQISILSPQRWSLARPHLSAQDLESIRKQSPVCWGGFLSQVDQFDPSFFGISAREAVSMSPQHRVLLEVAWETLEDAALRPDQLNKTNTGVFLGLTNRDYSHLAWNHHDLKDPYLTTGNSSSIAANRISYLLNLSGPCVVVDTACSSSLVAIHLACQSIRAGESTMAFAGGVNLTLDPDLMFNLAAGGFQAPDGRCKTFDSRADGYVRGEGAGLVLLKPLAQALTDGDPIHALILGSAVNQDGRTQGITAPKPTAQEAVVRQAYQQAGVSPGQVQYVETHGTGTKLGDPIELGALGKVLKDGRNPDDVCLVGAVKTNIGHLEAASGIAGLIKVVLSLQHRQIPPNLHFQSPNPYIPFGKLPVEVPQALTAWPSYGDDAIAGVSAFSFGGTNAHVVLQAAPHREKPVIQIERPLHLLTLSAKSTTALKDFAQRYEKHLQYHTEQTLGDICYTANIGRAHHDCRLAIVSTSKTDLMAKLKAFELGEDNSSFLEEQRSPNTQSNIAFLFTGQGSQYVDMGRELYETQLTFGRALDQCADILHEVNVPLLEVLYDQAEGDEQKINNTAYTQPALFALEYALYKLWQSWGINPSVVMGHSVGEYVAACVAGVFSLEDGLKLIAARGRLMQQLPSGGGMVSLMASVEQVKTVIADQPDGTIAAINGPQSTVISGPIPALQTMVEQFARAGVKGKFLSVSHAFHSPLMAPMLAEFEQVAKQVSYSPPKLKLISNVTGQVVTEAVATPDYWCEHILAPVNFAAGMERLQQEEINIFLECGPQPVLLGMGRQCLSEDEEIAWLPSLRPGQNDWQQILSSLGKLYICGVNIDWIGFDQDYPKRRKVTLPTYPFQRQHYWIEAVKQSMIGQRADKLIHPLLGQQLFLPTSQEIHFEANLNKNSPAYLGDHLVFDQLVFLGAGYLEMALAASLQIFQCQTLVLEDVSFVKALVLPSNGEDVSLHLVMKLESDQFERSIATWQIFSLNNQSGTEESDWILHARGKAIPQQADVATAPTCDLTALKARFPEEFNQNVYDQALGLSYGPLLRHIKQIWLAQGEALGHIQLQDMLALETEQYVLHPALLDSCFQTMFTLVGNHDQSFHISENPYLPVGISRLTLHRMPTTEVWSQGLLNTTDLANSQQSSTDINLFTPQGEAVVTIEGLKARKTSIQELFSHQPQEPQPVYQVEWRSQARFGRLASPAFLLSSTELNTALALQVQTLLLENSTLHQQYADLFPFLESASLHFIVNALNTLGWTYPPGEQLQLKQVAQRLGIVPQHHRLLGRLLEILVEADILTHQQGQWQVLKSLPTAETIPPSSSLVTESAEWQLLERCGSQLAAVLRGAIDPVQLVFPGGDLSHATRLYQDSPTAQSFNRLVQQVVTTAVANCPANRGLRILEIGAGTGGTTSALLPHLSAEKTCYCFTDIGAMFTQKAQERFWEAYPFVTYQTLDIEQNPSDQGFEMQQQDIVIAANVLHATRDLKQTLSHVRQLLAPGGLLVLLEGTARQRWVDLIFGLLDGWWRFSDRDLRPDYPLLNRAQWQQTLTETGFESVTVLPSEGVGDDLGQAVIVAQTDLSAAVESELEPTKGWLLLADQQGVAQQIAQQLEAKGERFIVVSQVPQDMAGYQHLVAQIQTQETELKGVIHCWGLETENIQTMDTQTLADAFRLGCGTLLPLVQALVQQEATPRLWIVTRGAQAVGTVSENLSGVSQASLWGMGKVIALEHPEFHCTCIDLDVDTAVEDQAEQLWAEVWSGESEDQVALRQDERFVARLTRSEPLVPAENEDAMTLSEGTYLITGGLGGLGLLVADWFIDHQAKHLVLVNRSAPSESVQAQLQKFREKGAQITVAQADVTDTSAMATIIDSIRQSDFLLKGIIHAAGVLDDGTLLQQSWSKFATVLGPKVQGAWNLHQLTQSEPLDFFVSFSSVAALLGSPGQANHAAANAFLDRLAHYRQSLGLAGQSFQLGAITQIGKVAERGADIRAQQQGMGIIRPQQVLEVLKQLLRHSGITQIGLVPVDWASAQLPPQWQNWSYLSDLTKVAQETSLGSSSAFMQQLQATAGPEQKSLLTAFVRKQVAQVLGIANPQEINESASFFDLGMDSLTSVEFRNRLQQQLGNSYAVSSTLAFDYPTVNRLATYLAEQLGALPAAAPKQKPIIARSLETDAVAIVGLACRFPGAPDKDAYWQLLTDGIDAIREVPPERWDIDAYYDPDPNAPGKMTTRYGGFIEAIDQFDAAFFGIAPREVIELDPQQRFLLEISWQALEDANIAPETLVGSQTGVYVGISTNDYSQLIARGGEQAIGQYMGTGNAASAAAGRLSYVLGLQGPSLAIDTACSSSLVALHQASHGLLKGDCELALVGGVNAILSPENTIYFSKGRFMAPDGRCKTFDATADGFVRSEGCGVVILKRLSEAERDGNHIYGVIRGSAVNQDGASGGLTVPNGPAQQRVIEQALTIAKIEPESVSYVEAHGTGTSLGDPIEIQALQQVLGQAHSSEQPLWVGSVKTNIGHLEAAAGIASIIKVALSFDHGVIPGQLHFHTPSPRIPWENINIQVVATAQGWPSRRRIAGVSGFAFQGTNAHLVLEGYGPSQVVDATPTEQKNDSSAEPSLMLLPLSGKSEAAVQALAAVYANWLEIHDDIPLKDVCFTAGVGRNHFGYRTTVVAQTQAQFRQGLQQVAAGTVDLQRIQQQPQIAVLFTGQGAQYIDMARELYETQPSFGQTLDQCSEILNAYLESPLLDVLYPDERTEQADDLLNQTAYTQPALFAIEYSLYQLWQSWGITPSVVMGHSIGEIVAACVAGIFSLEDGLKLSAMRGKLMGRLPSGGAMLSVMASVNQVRTLIAERGNITIAAINGPESTAISGEASVVRVVSQQLEAQGIKTKQLQVSHAFHSLLMEPILAEFEQVARQIRYSRPKLKLISNVTGQVVTEEIATPEYWCEHILAPVNFVAGMERLQQEEIDIFLECGPQPILLGMGRQCLPEDEDKVLLPSLRPGQNDWQQMLSSLSQLYVRGVSIDWMGFNQDSPQHCKVSLPTYPFQRQRYWIDVQASTNALTAKTAHDETLHPLLGHKVSLAGSQVYFESVVSSHQPTYLAEHRVFNRTLFPTTAYLEMGLAAGHQVFPEQPFTLEQFEIERGLILPESSPTQVQTLITRDAPDSYRFEIYSLSPASDAGTESQWQRHSHGLIRLASQVVSIPTVSLSQYQTECSHRCEVAAHYRRFCQQQIDYGDSFQGIQQLWQGDGKALAQLQLPMALVGDSADYDIHPALLDAALQVLSALDAGTETTTTYLPVAIERFEVYRCPGLSLWVLGQWQTTEQSTGLSAQVQLLDKTGQLIARIDGLHVRAATPAALLGQPRNLDPHLYQVDWRVQSRFGRLTPPDFLLSPPELSTTLAPQVQTLLLDNPTLQQHYATLLPSLEQVSVDFIVKAFGQLGWAYQPGEQLQLEKIAQRLGIVPQHHRLLARLLEILSDVKILTPQQDSWQVLQALPATEAITPPTPLVAASAEWLLLERCGSQLAAVLRGAIDPVQLVFPSGDLSNATRLYQDSPAAHSFNRLVQQVVTTAVTHAPATRGLRILEIGAGTGGTTSTLLPHLPTAQTRYCFTDIGALFTQKAQERFGHDYPFVSYQTLDIEQDPAEQGFAEQQQDIVIAANVLHATCDLKQTLSHVRQLLAPGGMLVLREGTARQRWVDLIFGLLDGWWRFSDRNLRPDYPLLNCTQWQQLLMETGFESVTVLPDESAGDDLGQAVIVAKTSAQTSTDLSKTDKSVIKPAKGWLLLADQQGIAQQLVQRLAAQGEACTVVQQVLQDVAGYQHLLTQLQTPETELQGVIHCWGLDVPDSQTMDAPDLAAASQLGCGTLLPLVQVLVQQKAIATPRLWIVTRGAQPVGASPENLSGVSQASMWGMGKVIGLEHPELSCTHIDLDGNATIAAQAESLWAEIWSQDKEDQVALRQDQRFVARLAKNEQLTMADNEAAMPRPEGTYLITGGLGGLGLLVADWFIDHQVKHLVLTNRREPSESVQAQLQKLREKGAQVTVAQADVTDAVVMATVIDNIRKSGFPLKGIIHAAGVLDDGTLLQQSWPKFEAVLGPKVQGAWNLHQLTQTESIDFFISFSSAAALLGSPGQANHSAANAFLDGLAHYRRSLGLAGQSFQLGAVTRIGEAAERGADVRAQKQGMGVIEPQQVLTILERLLRQPQVTQVGLVPIDWKLAQLPVQWHRWPYLSDWTKLSQSNAVDQTSAVIKQLQSTPVQEQKVLLVAFIRQQVAQVLGLKDAQQLDIYQSLFHIGLDSLMAVELRSQLQNQLNLSLSSTLLFNYPTIDALTNYILSEKLSTTSQSSESDAFNNSSRTNLQAEESLKQSRSDALDGLSEDELADLLSKKIHQRRGNNK